MFSEEGGVDISQLVLERGAVQGRVPDSIPGLKSCSSPHPASARGLRWAVQLQGTRWIWAFSPPGTAKKTSSGEVTVQNLTWVEINPKPRNTDVASIPWVSSPWGLLLYLFTYLDLSQLPWVKLGCDRTDLVLEHVNISPTELPCTSFLFLTARLVLHRWAIMHTNAPIIHPRVAELFIQATFHLFLTLHMLQRCFLLFPKYYSSLTEFW